jgi:DNA-binding response OmpR family regulator
MHLLYVSDRRIDAYLVNALREAGHLVETTDAPADGVVMAQDGGYQAIVLDWSSSSPADQVAQITAMPAQAFILVIAPPGDEGERAKVLRAGADACFARPVAFIELATRLEALARLVHRTHTAAAAAPIEMLPIERAVRVNDLRIALSAREFRLMGHLVEHAGEIVSLEQLHQQVWGESAEPRPDLARASLSRLRRKLESAGAGAVLRAVPGHGYVVDPRPDAGAPANDATAKMKIVSSS